MDKKEVVYSLTKTEKEMLLCISKRKTLKKFTEQEISNTYELLSQKQLISYDLKKQRYISLDNLAKEYEEKGLPEIQVLKKIIQKPKTIEQVNLPQEITMTALGELKRNNLATIGGKDKQLILTITKKGEEHLKNHINPLKYFSVSYSKRISLARTEENN